MSKVKDIYSPFSQIEDKYVIKQALSEDSGAAEIYDESADWPGRINIGDVTSDGFPDILVTLKFINSTTKSSILVSNQCNDVVCTSKAAKMRRRIFSVSESPYDAVLAGFDDAKLAVYFDLNENSMMDLLMIRGNAWSITAIYNNFGKDAFFLKTQVISDEAIGSTASSASFRCVLTDL